jgi:MbtH protein
MENDDTPFVVVMNHEEQYSIWPQHRTIPPGWHSVGEATSKAECLRYIEEHWTDLRPRSLREFLAASASR